MNIKFPELGQWWNDKFVPIIANKDRYLVLLGGRGSGKSKAVATMIVLRMLTHKLFIGCAIRKDLKLCRDSCHAEIVGVIEDLKLEKLFKYTESPTGVMEISCTRNKNKMMFGGLHEVDGIKSTKDLSFAWFEESVPETREEFKVIDRSIRTIKADWCQVVFSINPKLDTDPVKHWFYNDFRYSEYDGLDFRHVQSGEIDGQPVELAITAIHSSYRDNKFLRPELRFDLENEKDEYLYQVDTLGKWARRDVGGRFYKNFNMVKNIKDKEYDPLLPLFISFDFNTKPFLSLVIGQIVDKKIWVIDEMAFRSPNNYTKPAVLGFIKKYKDHRNKIYVTGDATGAKADTSQEIGHNNFKIIFDELYKHYGEHMVISRQKSINQSVSMRGSFINTIFLEGYNGIEVFINSKCSLLIDDMLNGLEKEDGTKLKQNYKDKESGETYEKWFHMADCFVGDTMIKTINGYKAIKDMKIGDLVLTRDGYKKVLKWWDKGIKKVETYRIGQNVITCTPDHKFYTLENGFTPIQELINKTTFLVYNKENGLICRENVSVTTESIGQDIQIQKEEATEFITQVVSQVVKRVKEKREQKGYIDIYGKSSTVKYQNIITLITKMVIHLITKSKTWHVCHQKNILADIIKRHHKSLKKNKQKDYLKHKKQQKNGTKVKKVESGTQNTPVIYSWLKREIVIVVENIMKDMVKSIAQKNVATGCRPGKSGREEKVYDIMVEGSHEFFANNILVHNCLDYLVVNNFLDDYKQFEKPGVSNWVIGERKFAEEW